MSDRSFVRAGGIAGILLAVASWAAVVEYFLLVPPAQQAPLAGALDANLFLASLATTTTGLVLFNGLYALVAFLALVATIAAYQRLRVYGEAWAFFATLVGTVASAGTIVASLGEVGRLRFLAQSVALTPAQAHLADPMGVTALNYAFREPAATNPVGVLTFGLTAVWFLVAGLVMWRGRYARLLALLGFVAFLDLAAGFGASLAGVATVPTAAALIAGAVGGPIFWLWLGILLVRDAGKDSS